MSFANNPAGFAAAFARTAAIVSDASSHAGADGHALLVETYIPGVEVALEGLLFDGQLTVLALFDKPDPLEGRSSRRQSTSRRRDCRPQCRRRLPR
ncbi:hypothetical protein [Candidatus Amarolinea dominans]|uniref:hypothetical protein n=1 Tax=Candidatus Amarolinea dominans TaxID=3140696 RepID=UPI0031CCBE4A